MQVTIISPIFPPEPVVSAKTSEDIAKRLVSQNHCVSVITTFPNRPAGKLFPGYHRSCLKTENNQGGYRLHRCFSVISRQSSMLSRWLENISFGIVSNLVLLFQAKPDVVYSNSWPIFATGLTSLICKLRKIPLVVSIQDLYPESLSLQGRLDRRGLVYKSLLIIDRWIARQASALIVVSDSFIEAYTLTRLVDPEKVNVVHNWIDFESIVKLDKNNYRKTVGVSKEAFVMIYGGNIGAAAGVETIIEALQNLHLDREVVFIVAGSGSHLESCQKLASSIKNARVIFHTPWAVEDTSKVLSSADVCILPTQGNQSLASIPSKLLSYMLVGKPVLALAHFESDLAKVIHNAKCGWVIKPTNLTEITSKIEELACTPEWILSESGLAGQRYAETHFLSETCLPRVIEIIKDASISKDSKKSSKYTNQDRITPIL